MEHGAPRHNGAALGDDGRQSERNLASTFNPGWCCSPWGTSDVRFVPLLPNPCALAQEPGSANFGIKYGFYNKWGQDVTSLLECTINQYKSIHTFE
jgi:hypothetical protein